MLWLIIERFKGLRVILKIKRQNRDESNQWFSWRTIRGRPNGAAHLGFGATTTRVARARVFISA